MIDLRRAAAATSIAAMLAFAPAALASGGIDSGGSGGGGGGGGGGTTTTPSGPCAQIASFSNTDGYYKIWAAIWTSFSITDNCGYAVNWSMTYTNGNTGAVDFKAASSTAYMPSGTIDEDWAALSTPYTVALTVTDPSNGAVLASTSALVTTKKPKSGV